MLLLICGNHDLKNMIQHGGVQLTLNTQIQLSRFLLGLAYELNKSFYSFSLAAHIRLRIYWIIVCMFKHGLLLLDFIIPFINILLYLGIHYSSAWFTSDSDWKYSKFKVQYVQHNRGSKLAHLISYMVHLK